MTNEELNFVLYTKMRTEFEAFRDSLIGQPGDLILKSAYEYAAKEDILYCVQENEFSDKQCKALMKLEKPLDAVFQHYEKYGRSRMPDLYDAVEAKSNAVMREEFLKRRQAR